MPQTFEVNEMSSQDFHTLALQGWGSERYGSAVVTYEPWLCAFLWKSRYDNRSISPADLDKIRQALLENRWCVNGETMIYTRDFQALDCQHRLRAGIDTQKPFQAFSIWGIAPAVHPTIDIGKKRSAADHLSIAKVPNYATTAAALRVLYRLEHKAMRTTTVNLPDDDVLPYLTQHPKIKYSVNVSDAARAFLLRSIGAALHYEFARRQQDLADMFFHDLSQGANLQPRDPVLLLRDFLSGTRTQKKQNPYRRAQDTKARADMAAVVIVVWNALRRKKTVALPYLKSVDTRPFPEIV